MDAVTGSPKMRRRHAALSLHRTHQKFIQQATRTGAIDKDMYSGHAAPVT